MGVGKTTFTFSKSSISVDGGSTNISLTRDNQSYTNKLSHGYGDIYTFPAGTTDYTWKPTAAQLTKFFEEVPAQKTRLIDVYLDTYNGTTKVGRDSHALTVTLSQATGKPTISNFGVDDSNSVASAMGVIVVGKSSLAAGATVTPKYGASITKTQFVYGKKTSGTSAITNGGFLDIDSLVESLPLTTTPTDYVIGYMAGDSRGFNSQSALITKTFVKYQAPHIDNFEVVRRDTSGNEDENGTKALVVIKGGWASINGKNTATLKVGYKTEGATSYTYQTISVTDGTVDVTQTLNATLATDTDYVFSVQLTDKFETFTESGVGCSNVQSILYISADGNELVMGSNASNNVLIDPNGVSIRDGSTVNASFTKDKIELGKGNQNATISMLDDSLFIHTSLTDENELAMLSSADGLSLSALSGDNEANGNIQIYKGSGAGSDYVDMLLSIGQVQGTAVAESASIQLGTKISDDGSTVNSHSDIFLNADSVHVSGSFTEDIPVLNSGDCNTLTDTGKYYIGASGTNKPGSGLNGWLESKKYSTDYCYQTYTTYQGQTYRRLMSAGTWDSWVCTSGDYVIAQGTSGVWTYRRWASGLAECWRKVQYTANGNNNYGNNINAASNYVAQVNYPFTFSDYPIVSCTCYSPNIQVFTSISGGTKSLSPLVQAAAPSGKTFGSSTTIISTIYAMGNV